MLTSLQAKVLPFRQASLHHLQCGKQNNHERGNEDGRHVVGRSIGCEVGRLLPSGGVKWIRSMVAAIGSGNRSHGAVSSFSLPVTHPAPLKAILSGEGDFVTCRDTGEARRMPTSAASAF